MRYFYKVVNAERNDGLCWKGSLYECDKDGKLLPPLASHLRDVSVLEKRDSEELTEMFGVPIKVKLEMVEADSVYPWKDGIGFNPCFGGFVA